MAETQIHKIKAKDWNAYKDALAKINEAASDTIKYANTDIAFTSDEFADWVEYVARHYGDATAELACQMFEATATMQGVKNVKAEPINAVTREGITRIIKESEGDIVVLSNRVGTMVKKQASKTTLYNARKYGCEVAWIPSGDSCPFCMMLASNGWRTARRKYDINSDVHAHKNCKCEYAIRFNDSLDVDGYDPQAIYDQFPEGGNWNEKMNAYRQEHYEENKDKINAQKREAYARRQANNSDG